MRKNRAKYILFILLFFLGLKNVSADTHTWDGGGADDDWTTADNWVSDVAPSTGDDLVFSGAIRLSANNDYTTNTTFNSITFSAGAGDFSLSGNAINLSGGASAITASNTTGTMTIGIALAFTTGAPTITTTSGGTLEISGTIQNNAWTVTCANAGVLNFSGVISGGGGLTQTGSNTLTITATNTYTGVTTISAGIFSIGDGGAGGEISNSSSITNNSELLVNKSSDWTYSGVISGSGTLEKQGAGKLTLSATNTFTGDVTFPEQNSVDGGIIAISNADGLGDGPKTVELLGFDGVGNIIELSGGITVPSDITLDTRGRGSGVTPVFLRNKSGVNTWSGAVNIVNSGGDYEIESEAGTLTISGTFSNDHSSERWIRLIGAGDGEYSGIIQDGTSELNVIKNGTGTWVLTGTNTYTGSTTINAGELQVGDNGTTGVIPATGITNNSVLTFFRSDDITYSAVISGTGSLTKKGAGTLTLSGTNTFTGDIDFEAQSARDDGAILVTNANGLGSGAKTINMLGSVGVSNVIELSGGITVSDVDIETNGRNGSNNTFLKNISGNNTWTGDIKIVSSGGSYHIESDADELTISGDLINNYVTSSRTFTLTGSGDGVVSGVIQDGLNTSALTKSSTGTWILTGTNTYTGTTTINNGILQVGNNGTTGSIAGASIVTGATLQFYRSNDIEYSGVISSVGQVKKEGAGTLTLSGVNTYSGKTVINDGTLTLGVDDALSATNVTISDATFSSGATTGYDATIGTLTITGSNIIDLGSGDHTLSFTASSGETWGTSLSIEGWSDTDKYDGTAAGASHPKIFVGANSSGLSADQLAKVSFVNPSNAFVFTSTHLGTGEVVPTNIVLPVELLNFSATVNNDVVEVNWSTASEINSDYFILLHSSDGVNYFELDRLAAAGNSSSIIKYDYTHLTPSAFNYYKLIQVDFDGTINNQGVRVAHISDLDVSVNVFPNPSTEYFNVQSFNEKIQFYKLFDSKGDVIEYKSVNQFNFKVGNSISAGVYNMQLFFSNEIKNIKLIKY